MIPTPDLEWYLVIHVAVTDQTFIQMQWNDVSDVLDYAIHKIYIYKGITCE